jgi:threonine/homoserine/homoserine lactone efflux protein
VELPVLVRGLLIGVSIAAPVGPIGVLCIRRTLNEGRLIGLATGLGAASADAIYGLIAGFGLSLINLLLGQSSIIRLVGGLFLCYLGIQTLLSRPSEQAAQAKGAKLLGAYSSTLVLTLTNPMTILSFIGIFAGLGISTEKDVTSTLLLVLGVFLGSAAWWVGITSLIARIRDRLETQHLRWINIGSGLIIVAFGFLALVSLLTQ